MSIDLVPPFKVVTRIGGSIVSDAGDISLKPLREAVAGKDRGFSRARAMALLLESDFPNKHRDYEKVLDNDKESPEIRHLAALYLGMTNTAASLETLIVKSSQITDEYVLSGVVKALGRVGDERALDAVSRVQQSAKGEVADQARFAAALIAHRLGRDGYELTAPSESDYVEPPVCDTRSMEISLADETDAEICLRSLARQSLAIEFAENPMYQIRCGQNIWMLVLNRDLCDSKRFGTAKERKTCLGVVAKRNRPTGLYDTSFVILTSPSRETKDIDVLVYRLAGNIALGGKALSDGAGASFSVKSVSGPRGFGVQIEGYFEAGRLEIKTAVSTPLGEKRQPVAESLPKPATFAAQ